MRSVVVAQSHIRAQELGGTNEGLRGYTNVCAPLLHAFHIVCIVIHCPPLLHYLSRLVSPTAPLRGWQLHKGHQYVLERCGFEMMVSRRWRWWSMCHQLNLWNASITAVVVPWSPVDQCSQSMTPVVHYMFTLKCSHRHNPWFHWLLFL